MHAHLGDGKHKLWVIKLYLICFIYDFRLEISYKNWKFIFVVSLWNTWNNRSAQALRLFHSFPDETTKINYQFLNILYLTIETKLSISEMTNICN